MPKIKSSVFVYKATYELQLIISIIELMPSDF